MDLGVSPITGKRRSLVDIPRSITGGLQSFADVLNRYSLKGRQAAAAEKANPFQSAPVGTPFVKGGVLGYKGPNNQWIPRGDIDAPSQIQTPVITPAGVVQPGVIVKGLTPAGTVDRTQGDEYKAQMAQYQNLIKQQKQAEAEDLGMKIFMEKYAKSPIAQAGGAIGAYNPLLAATFPETKGVTGTFAPVEEYQMGDLGSRAQGEMGPTMETLNPLASQAAQQEATATQADMATTAGLSAGDRARNLTRAFRLGLI